MVSKENERLTKEMEQSKKGHEDTLTLTVTLTLTFTITITLALTLALALPQGVTPSVPAASPKAELDFSFLGTECTRIKGAQNRAMTLRQLRRLREFLLMHANPDDSAMEWVDRAPPQHSKTSGQRLNVHTINLYQVHAMCFDSF